tara:strand:+ start:205 stop:834 length:630 start_codon:yes stop_codon:yes gene_type:complete
MQYLLYIHIIAGSISLIAAACAGLSSKGEKVHILAGRTYFWGMAIIFLTAIPMSIASSNVFLFLIAIFSFYLAYAGMRFARNRKGIANFFDWLAIGLMVLSGLVMWLLAAFYFMNNNSQYITLTVFGFIAMSLGYADFRSYKNKSAIGKQRIARHLTNMLAGTIAVITAVLVTNVHIKPVFILWILPTIVITTLIFWWNRKILGANKPN